MSRPIHIHDQQPCPYLEIVCPIFMSLAPSFIRFSKQDPNYLHLITTGKQASQAWGNGRWLFLVGEQQVLFKIFVMIWNIFSLYSFLPSLSHFQQFSHRRLSSNSLRSPLIQSLTQFFVHSYNHSHRFYPYFKIFSLLNHSYPFRGPTFSITNSPYLTFSYFSKISPFLSCFFPTLLPYRFLTIF